MSSLYSKNEQVLDDRSLDFVPPEREGVFGAAVGLMHLTAELVSTIPGRVIKLGRAVLGDTAKD